MTVPNDANLKREPQLSADDRIVLDSLAEAGFNPAVLGDIGPMDARRVEAMSALFELMKDYPVEDADETLIHATLARIDQHERRQDSRMKFETQVEASSNRSRGWRIRIPDLITMAAVLLIGVSVFWPVMNSIRSNSIDTACANNMKQLGYAFSNYSADSNGSLPVAMAGFGGAGRSIEKSVLDLGPLVNNHYCELGHLNCPGHQHEANGIGPSYSLRWIVPGSRMNWGTGMGQRMTVVVGDLNPVVEAARSGSVIPPLSMSINHAGRGQNVLVSDGSTMWLDEPLVGSDNIWLPAGATELRSNERPTDPLDVFLMH